MGIFLFYLTGVIVGYFAIGLMDHLIDDTTYPAACFTSWIIVGAALFIIIIKGVNSIPAPRKIFERKQPEKLKVDERKELYDEFAKHQWAPQFSMSKVELDRFNEWKIEQNKLKQPGELYNYTYCFTPDGIGTNIVVECSNGNQMDVTDYDSY